jgi:hypothetical protein
MYNFLNPLIYAQKNDFKKHVSAIFRKRSSFNDPFWRKKFQPTMGQIEFCKCVNGKNNGFNGNNLSSRVTRLGEFADWVNVYIYWAICWAICWAIF